MGCSACSCVDVLEATAKLRAEVDGLKAAGKVLGWICEVCGGFGSGECESIDTGTTLTCACGGKTVVQLWSTEHYHKSHNVTLQNDDLRQIILRARWTVSMDNLCDCHGRYGEPHAKECLVFAISQFDPEKPRQHRTGCDHDWKDARNEHVQSGEICLKCMTIRAGNAESK